MPKVWWRPVIWRAHGQRDSISRVYAPWHLLRSRSSAKQLFTVSSITGAAVLVQIIRSNSGGTSEGRYTLHFTNVMPGPFVNFAKLLSIIFSFTKSFRLHYGPNRNEPVRRADNLTTFMCRFSWNLGASTSWEPQDLSRLVMGLFYLLLSIILIVFYCSVRSNFSLL